jgi:hypothetical protein
LTSGFQGSIFKLLLKQYNADSHTCDTDSPNEAAEKKQAAPASGANSRYLVMSSYKILIFTLT